MLGRERKGLARWTTWANGQPISQAHIIYSKYLKKKKNSQTHTAFQGLFGWRMEKYEVRKDFSFSHLCFVGGGKLEG